MEFASLTQAFFSADFTDDTITSTQNDGWVQSVRDVDSIIILPLVAAWNKQKSKYHFSRISRRYWRSCYWLRPISTRNNVWRWWVAAPTTIKRKSFFKLSIYIIMSSGFGLKGTIGRCYPFFADYKDCLVSGLNERWNKIEKFNDKTLTTIGSLCFLLLFSLSVLVHPSIHYLFNRLPIHSYNKSKTVKMIHLLSAFSRRMTTLSALTTRRSSNGCSRLTNNTPKTRRLQRKGLLRIDNNKMV